MDIVFEAASPHGSLGIIGTHGLMGHDIQPVPRVRESGDGIDKQEAGDLSY